MIGEILILEGLRVIRTEEEYRNCCDGCVFKEHDTGECKIKEATDCGTSSSIFKLVEIIPGKKKKLKI